MVRAAPYNHLLQQEIFNVKSESNKLSDISPRSVRDIQLRILFCV